MEWNRLYLHRYGATRDPGLPLGPSGSTSALWVAFGAFVAIALVAVYLYWSAKAFTYDFVQDDLLARYEGQDADQVLHALIEQGSAGYRSNRT